MGLNPLELNPTRGVFVAFSPLTRLFHSAYEVSAHIFLGCAYPDALPLSLSEENHCCSCSIPAWESRTDGMFSKATLSNLDALDKERGRAGHSHCLSGLTLLFLWFVASLGCSSSDPTSAAGCHTCILHRVSMNPLALLGSWKQYFPLLSF